MILIGLTADFLVLFYICIKLIFYIDKVYRVKMVTVKWRYSPTVMPRGLPWLYKRVLGWIISGLVPKNQENRASVLTAACSLAISACLEAVQE